MSSIWICIYTLVIGELELNVVGEEAWALASGWGLMTAGELNILLKAGVLSILNTSADLSELMLEGTRGVE